ncbi:MAG: universal stress protein [Burkholderiaceae bacterium]
MFAKILIPTDGSQLARQAMLAGIAFAQTLHAEVVGVFIAPKSHYPIYIESVPPAYVSEEDYRLSLKTAGETFLCEMKNLAEKAGLKFSGEVSFSDATAAAIVQTAHAQHCDLIFIASHGTTGQQNHSLGSVALKVVSLAQLPVLVFRSAADASAETQNLPEKNAGSHL